jgi:hypothetical protein
MMEVGLFRKLRERELCGKYLAVAAAPFYLLGNYCPFQSRSSSSSSSSNSQGNDPLVDPLQHQDV